MDRFIVRFQYMDGDKFELEVHPDDMEAFMAAVNGGEVFFNSKRGIGIWIPIDKVRYFQVERVDAKGQRVVERDTEIQAPERGAQGGEGGDREDGGECLEGAVQAPGPDSQPVGGVR